MRDIISAIARIEEFRIHPLGFFYLLDKQQDGVARRIHVWPAGSASKPGNDRHQHSFDINSTVYAGRIRSEIFSFVERQDGNEHEFRVSYKNGNSVLSSTGRKGILDSICMFETSGGNSYFLQSGIIHRVTVLERPCVTLLRTKETGITIFSYGNDVAEPPFERRLVGKAEAKNIVHILESVRSEATVGSEWPEPK